VTTKFIKASELHAKHYAEDAAYRKAYDGLRDEYALIHGRLARRMEDLDVDTLKALAAAEVPADYACLDNLDLGEPS